MNDLPVLSHGFRGLEPGEHSQADEGTLVHGQILPPGTPLGVGKKGEAFGRGGAQRHLVGGRRGIQGGSGVCLQDGDDGEQGRLTPAAFAARGDRPEAAEDGTIPAALGPHELPQENESRSGDVAVGVPRERQDPVFPLVGERRAGVLFQDAFHGG